MHEQQMPETAANNGEQQEQETVQAPEAAAQPTTSGNVELAQRLVEEAKARKASYDLQMMANNELAHKLSSRFGPNLTISDKAFTIKSKIDQFRRDASHISEVHCQDLLYYGVIDMVANDTCATAVVLKDELEELVAYTKVHLQLEYKKSEDVKGYINKLLKTIPDLKNLMKEEKRRIRESENANLDSPVDRHQMKTVVKMVKLFVKATNNGEVENWLKEEMTELEFMARFVIPLIDLTVRLYSNSMSFKPCEQELNHVGGYEDDTSLPSPKIDGIIMNQDVDLPIALVEVSCSPNNPSENRNHFKGDRKKLAKNLKYVFKAIISRKDTPHPKSVIKLKLFGVHLYYDHLYIYSMSTPIWDVFVFKLEFKFAIPVRPALFPSTLPLFLSKMSRLGELLGHFSNELQTFISTEDYESCLSYDSNKPAVFDSKISPLKRKHNQ